MGQNGAAQICVNRIQALLRPGRQKWHGWPKRGQRIGEASHPGPVDAEFDHLFGDCESKSSDENEDQRDIFHEPVEEMATDPEEDVLDGILSEIFSSDETLPPSGGFEMPQSLHFGPDFEMVGEPAATTPVYINDSAPVAPNSPPLLRCPFCTGFAKTGPVRGLMVHLSSRHSGAVIDDAARSVLCGLDRGLCTGCGCVLSMRSHTCHRCHLSALPREPRVGDVIKGTRRREQMTTAADQDIHMNINGGVPAIAVDDRPGLLERVRKLSSNTEVHNPSALRNRFANNLTHILKKMNEGDEEAFFLEELRSKLLLSPVPKKRNRRVELSLRLQLWEQRDLIQLVTRIEEQARNRPQKRAVGQGGGKKGKRAKYLVREGARARAVACLVSDLAELTPEEERKYAEELLPRSEKPELALSGGPDGSVEVENDDANCNLKGVRFKALSALGPSGARPEHLRELLSCGNKRIARNLLIEVGKFINVAAQGRLPDSARFILDSRVVYIRKKRGVIPRPVRVGELWRRVIAKKLLHIHHADIKAVCEEAKQYGVGQPGGAETLIHFRLILEKIFRSGTVNEAMALVDIDLQNAFPSLEWDAIREAIMSDLPQLSQWCKWCHASSSAVYLPSGGTVECDRGAEQGDPLGPVFCAVVLSRVMKKND